MKCRNFREKKIHVNKYKSASQVYKTKNVKKLFRLSKFWGKNYVFVVLVQQFLFVFHKIIITLKQNGGRIIYIKKPIVNFDLRKNKKNVIYNFIHQHKKLKRCVLTLHFLYYLISRIILFNSFLRICIRFYNNRNKKYKVETQ